MKSKERGNIKKIHAVKQTKEDLKENLKNLRTGLPKGYNNMPILNQKTFLINTPYNNIMQKGENSSFKIINLATASRECSKK